MGRLRTPGPGAYDTPSYLTVGGSPQGRPSASFASNSTRNSGAKGDATGDPGAYDIERGGVHMGKKEPISARSRRSHNRDINLGKGSFVSTSKRSSTPPARSTRGGPGEHDYAHLYACGRASQATTSSFLSASPLAGHIRKSDTPGVGEYDPNDKERFQKKSFSKEGSPMFAGSLKSRSAAINTATGEHVGPGSYELEQRSIGHKMTASINPRLPGFMSSSVRSGPED